MRLISKFMSNSNKCWTKIGCVCHFLFSCFFAVIVHILMNVLWDLWGVMALYCILLNLNMHKIMHLNVSITHCFKNAQIKKKLKYLSNKKCMYILMHPFWLCEYLFARLCSKYNIFFCYFNLRIYCYKILTIHI